jgi:fructose-1,6-bisphosphatase
VTTHFLNSGKNQRRSSSPEDRREVQGESQMAIEVMANPKVVSRLEWLDARKALLDKEKDLTRKPRPAERRATQVAMGPGR